MTLTRSEAESVKRLMAHLSKEASFMAARGTPKREATLMRWRAAVEKMFHGRPGTCKGCAYQNDLADRCATCIRIAANYEDRYARKYE